MTGHSSFPATSRVALLICLVLALTGCSSHFVCPDRGGPPWRELKTDHFVLRTNLEPEPARKVIDQLEQMRAAILLLFSKKPEDVPGSLKVIAFATTDEFHEFVGNNKQYGIFGRYLNGGEGGIVIPGDLAIEHRRLIAHELTHFISARFINRQPKWFAEGLAGYFETVGDKESDDGKLAAGKLQPYFWRIIREEPVTAREVLEWRDVKKNEVAFYAKSWLLVHYLLSRNSSGFHAYSGRLAREEDSRTAWNAVFPMWNLDKPAAIRKLDEELETYRLVADFREKELKPQGSAPFVSRPLSSGEVHALRLENRQNWKPEAVEAEIREALAEDTAHVAALTAKALGNPKGGLALARQAVQAHPEDPLAWRLLGTQLVGPAAAKEREKAFVRALELAPDQPQLLLDLALALGVQGKLEESLPLYQRAIRLSLVPLGASYYYAFTLNELGRCSEAADVTQRSMDMLHGDDVPENVLVQYREKLAAAQKKCLAGVRPRSAEAR